MRAECSKTEQGQVLSQASDLRWTPAPSVHLEESGLQSFPVDREVGLVTALAGYSAG